MAGELRKWEDGEREWRYAQRRKHSGDRTFFGNVILLHGIPARAIRDEQAAAIAALLAWAATAAEAGDDAKDG